MNTSSNFFTRLIDWLKLHKGYNLLILIIYYLIVVLPHVEVGVTINKFFFRTLKLSYDNYNLIIASLGIIGLLLYGVVFVKQVKQDETKNKVWFYLIATILLSILILKILFVINIEAVHYVQYAVFAFLCFPLIQNYWQTLILATIAGSVDEAYQYFILEFWTAYFDFNDVLTDLIGAAFGLVFIRAHGIKGGIEGIKPFLKSTAFIALATLTLLILGLWISGILAIYPYEGSEASYTVVNEPPTQFWSEVPNRPAFHMVRPFEGLVLTILLWLFYIPLGKSIQ